jgi:hypothetical protein
MFRRAGVGVGRIDIERQRRCMPSARWREGEEDKAVRYYQKRGVGCHASTRRSDLTATSILSSSFFATRRRRC